MSDTGPIVVLDHPLDSNAYGAPATSCSGTVRSDFGRAGSLWMVRASLEEGSSLEWTADHGDEAVFVISGECDLDGHSCASGAGVFIPAGSAARLTASGPLEIAHYGSVDTPARRDDGGSYAIALAQAQRFVSHGDDGREFVLHFHADGTDPRCRAAMFTVAVDGQTFAPPHSHTKDEIIHVLDGEIRVGTIRVGAGSSIGVAHDMRYSFRTECPTTFLNYRDGESSIVIRKGEVVSETMARRLAEAAGSEPGTLD